MPLISATLKNRFKFLRSDSDNAESAAAANYSAPTFDSLHLVSGTHTLPRLNIREDNKTSDAIVESPASPDDPGYQYYDDKDVKEGESADGLDSDPAEYVHTRTLTVEEDALRCISMHDDVEMPVNTLRMWTIGVFSFVFPLEISSSSFPV